MTLYARHNPATYDLTGISEVHFTALREALALLHEVPLPDDVYAESYEAARINHVAALDLIEATNAAVRAAQGITDD